MVSDASGQQLHDRATRGEILSAEEQAHLNTWYDEQDRAEMRTLEPGVPSENQAYLQAEIDRILQQIGNATRRIQEISQQNELLRQDIVQFRHQLAQRVAVQVI